MSEANETEQRVSRREAEGRHAPQIRVSEVNEYVPEERRNVRVSFAHPYLGRIKGFQFHFAKQMKWKGLFAKQTRMASFQLASIRRIEWCEASRPKGSSPAEGRSLAKPGGLEEPEGMNPLSRRLLRA